MHRGLAAFEVLRYQRDQLGVCLAVDWRSLHLRQPGAVVGPNK
jgi:hypothetical protein